MSIETILEMTDIAIREAADRARARQAETLPRVRDKTRALITVSRLFGEHPETFVDKAMYPEVPLTLTHRLVDRDAVQSAAELMGVEVTVREHDGFVHYTAIKKLPGLTFHVFAVEDKPVILRRDPEATAELAERDA